VGVKFDNCDMCGMRMDHNSREIKFTSCNLAGADMSGTLLRSAVFQDCNLSGSNMSGANLRNAKFINSNTSSINLTAANIAYTNGLTDINIDQWYQQTLATITTDDKDE